MTRNNAVLVSFPPGILERLEALVESGLFSKKQDAIREAVRRFVQDRETEEGA